MQVLLLALKYLPALIGLAEGLFSWKAKSGADKKAFVKTSMAAAISGVAAESTGGQAKTWEALEGSMDALIDGTVAVMNAAGAFKSAIDDYTTVID